MNSAIPWNWRYRTRLYLRNTVWIPPALGILLAMLTARVFDRLDISTAQEARMTPDAARTVLVTLASAMFTFIVFVSSMLLLALQLASSQLTPRAIALVFCDSVTKRSSALFAFTFTLVMAVVVRITDAVPLVQTRLAAYCCILSLGVFFFMIDHIGKALRPHGVMRLVAAKGRRVIQAVYASPAAGSAPVPRSTPTPSDNSTLRTVHAHADGVLLACDVPGLVALAARTSCVIELLPQIGDFVAAGTPLLRVQGGSPPPSADQLRGMVALGHERTMEQDPAFAFRIIVDIACKALSPAINDPTTAVLAIDQIHHLLRNVGQRHLDEDRIIDAAGQTRLLYRMPAWADFVHLAVTEIRHYGGSSIQVTRRLRAMLENLVETLPPERAPLLHEELSILHRSTSRFFSDPEDQAMAEISDAQGVGGAEDTSRSRQTRPGTAERESPPTLTTHTRQPQQGREQRQRSQP